MTFKNNSIILYPGGILGKNSRIVWTFWLLIKAPVVMLQSTRIALILCMLTCKSDSCLIWGSKTRFVKPKNRPIESVGLKFTGFSQKILHFKVLLCDLSRSLGIFNCR